MTFSENASEDTLLIVTAPLGLRNRTATVTATGASVLVDATLELATVHAGAHTISGSFRVPIPKTPGQPVLVHATVGGFSGPTLAIRIAP